MNPIAPISFSFPKTRPYLLLFLGCLFFLLSGCTEKLTQLVPSRLHRPNRDFVIIRDYDTTWNALVRALDEKKGPKVTKKKKETGTIVLAPVSVATEAFCDCGKIGKESIQGRGIRKTVIRLQKRAPQECLIVVLCSYSTTYHWKDIHGRTVRKENIPCVSNGKYELDLYEWVIGYMSP